MALAVDASSPARVTVNATSSTTASFDPPASLLVACVNSDPSVTVTMSNNGAALTWTTIVERKTGDTGSPFDCLAGGYYAVLPSGRTGMTVTCSVGGTAQDHSLKLYVLTGANTASPVGGSNEGSSTTNNLTTTGFTVAAAGSLGFVVGDDFSTPGSPTSSDTTFDAAFTTSQLAGGSGYKTLGSAGSSATFNLDAAGTGAVEWNWVSFEIKAAAASVNTAAFFNFF